LLTECPYTLKVWRLLGVHTNDVKVALGTHLTREEFEIHAHLLSSIVFRKGTLPPNTLIESTLLKHSKIVCRNEKVKEMATAIIPVSNGREIDTKVSIPCYGLLKKG
jgi:hypothetical protein